MGRTGFVFIVIYSIGLSSEVLGSGCTLTANNSNGLDLLKKLQPLIGIRLQKTVNVKEGKKEVPYKYQMGICIDAVSDDDKYKNVGMIQTELGNKKLHVVGRYDQTQLMGGDNWILLKYKGGDRYNTLCQNLSSAQRQAHIMITCDPTKEVPDDLIVIEENTDVVDECYYLFQINSKVACRLIPMKEEGLSSGSVFCIIFFIFVLIYLIIGFLYQRIVVGAQGLEQIPNFSFWKEFGKLQADGCDFLCRCGERQEMKMYRGIDDQLLNTERREEPDDHLLSM